MKLVDRIDALISVQISKASQLTQDFSFKIRHKSQSVVSMKIIYLIID